MRWEEHLGLKTNRSFIAATTGGLRYRSDCFWIPGSREVLLAMVESIPAKKEEEERLGRAKNQRKTEVVNRGLTKRQEDDTSVVRSSSRTGHKEVFEAEDLM